MLIQLLWRSLERRKGHLILAVLAVALGAALASALLAISLDITDKMAKELRTFGANIIAQPKQRALTVEIAGMRYTSASDGAYLNESDLPKLKTIFWRNNIVGFAPSLSGAVDVNGQKVLLVGAWFEKEIPIPTTKRTIALPGGQVREVTPESKIFATGIQSIAPWWKVDGAWIDQTNAARGAILGTSLARQWEVRVGDTLRVTYSDHPYEFIILGIATTGGFEENQIFVDLANAQKIFGLPGKIEKVQISALVKP
ncbi:MAG: ABC transporter permease, partial [Chloroflexi bacterium]|nr:ABC transporter permease [Chloroflexota bacterium]